MPKSNDPFSGQSFAQKCPKKRTLFPGKLPATQQAFKESEKKMQPYLRHPRYELPRSMWDWPVLNSDDCFSKVLECYVPSIPPNPLPPGHGAAAAKQQHLQQLRACASSSHIMECSIFDDDEEQDEDYCLEYSTPVPVQELRYPHPPPPAEIRLPQVTFSKNQASDAYIKQCIFGDDDKVPRHVYIVDGYIVPVQYDEGGTQQSKRICPEYSCSSEDGEDQEQFQQDLQTSTDSSSSYYSGTSSNISSQDDSTMQGPPTKRGQKRSIPGKYTNKSKKSSGERVPMSEKRQANVRMLAKAISDKRVSEMIAAGTASSSYGTKYEKKVGGRKCLLKFTPEVKRLLDAALLDKINNNEVCTVSLNVYK